MRWPVGGKRLTKEERDEILQLYMSHGRAAADRLAASKGLDTWYAYKLAHQSGLLPITRWSREKRDTVTEMVDPIIDRSEAQKELRVLRLRAELLDLGYSVVKTEWLHSRLDPVPVLEAAE
jgi:hypothetical protein